MKQFLKNSLLLFFVTLSIYILSHRGEGANWNHFIYLADAFLHGHLYISKNLTEVISTNGGYFVVYPPMPAILLMPFVAIFGTNFYQPLLSITLGAINVSLSYLVFFKIFKNNKISIWMSILYGFGTIQWYHAEVGSSWYVAHIVALFFLWLSLLEAFTKKRFFLLGLLISFAYLARLPTILVSIFFAIYLYKDFLKIKNIILFILGLSIGIIINTFYNYLRFGTIFDVGYSLLPIFNEPWYKYGLFSFKYIPTHLIEVFTFLPYFSKSPPFMIPNMYIMAFWLTTPAFLLVFKTNFKTRLAIASLITIILTSLPGLMHGNNGSSQFGYRFALDFMPFLLILTALGIRNNFRWYIKASIILSILINAWGVIMISSLNLWKI